MASSCPECGHSNAYGTLFCDGCGRALTSEAQRRAPAQAPRTAGSLASASAARSSTGEMAASTAVADADADADRDPAPEGSQYGDSIEAWAEATGHGLLSVQPGAARGIDSGDLSAPPASAVPRDIALAPAATVAYLVSDSGRRVDVPGLDVAIVGREDVRSGIRPDVDLTLDGASAAGVSRRHCRMLRQSDGWYVEDLMSTNFTVLNGQALTPHVPARMQHGDQLRLGKLRLTFHEH